MEQCACSRLFSKLSFTLGKYFVCNAFCLTYIADLESNCHQGALNMFQCIFFNFRKEDKNRCQKIMTADINAAIAELGRLVPDPNPVETKTGLIKQRSKIQILNDGKLRTRHNSIVEARS